MFGAPLAGVGDYNIVVPDHIAFDARDYVLHPAPAHFTPSSLPPQKQGTWHFGVHIRALRRLAVGQASLLPTDSYDIWRRWDDCLELQKSVEREYRRFALDKRTHISNLQYNHKSITNADRAASFESLPSGIDPSSIPLDVHPVVPTLTKKSTLAFRSGSAQAIQRAEEFDAFCHALFTVDDSVLDAVRESERVRGFFGWWKRDRDSLEKTLKAEGRLPLPSSTSSASGHEHGYGSPGDIAIEYFLMTPHQVRDLEHQLEGSSKGKDLQIEGGTDPVSDAWLRARSGSMLTSSSRGALTMTTTTTVSSTDIGSPTSASSRGDSTLVGTVEEKEKEKEKRASTSPGGRTRPWKSRKSKPSNSDVEDFPAHNNSRILSSSKESLGSSPLPSGATTISPPSPVTQTQMQTPYWTHHTPSNGHLNGSSPPPSTPPSRFRPSTNHGYLASPSSNSPSNPSSTSSTAFSSPLPSPPLLPPLSPITAGPFDFVSAGVNNTSAGSGLPVSRAIRLLPSPPGSPPPIFTPGGSIFAQQQTLSTSPTHLQIPTRTNPGSSISARVARPQGGRQPGHNFRASDRFSITSLDNALAETLGGFPMPPPSGPSLSLSASTSAIPSTTKQHAPSSPTHSSSPGSSPTLYSPTALNGEGPPAAGSETTPTGHILNSDSNMQRSHMGWGMAKSRSMVPLRPATSDGRPAPGSATSWNVASGGTSGMNGLPGAGASISGGRGNRRFGSVSSTINNVGVEADDAYQRARRVTLSAAPSQPTTQTSATRLPPTAFPSSSAYFSQYPVRTHLSGTWREEPSDLEGDLDGDSEEHSVLPYRQRLPSDSETPQTAPPAPLVTGNPMGLGATVQPPPRKRSSSLQESARRVGGKMVTSSGGAGAGPPMPSSYRFSRQVPSDLPETSEEEHEHDGELEGEEDEEERWMGGRTIRAIPIASATSGRSRPQNGDATVKASSAPRDWVSQLQQLASGPSISTDTETPQPQPKLRSTRSLDQLAIQARKAGLQMPTRPSEYRNARVFLSPEPPSADELSSADSGGRPSTDESQSDEIPGRPSEGGSPSVRTQGSSSGAGGTIDDGASSIVRVSEEVIREFEIVTIPRASVSVPLQTPTQSTTLANTSNSSRLLNGHRPTMSMSSVLTIGGPLSPLRRGHTVHHGSTKSRSSSIASSSEVSRVHSHTSGSGGSLSSVLKSEPEAFRGGVAGELLASAKHALRRRVSDSSIKHATDRGSRLRWFTSKSKRTSTAPEAAVAQTRIVMNGGDADDATRTSSELASSDGSHLSRVPSSLASSSYGPGIHQNVEAGTERESFRSDADTAVDPLAPYYISGPNPVPIYDPRSTLRSSISTANSFPVTVSSGSGDFKDRRPSDGSFARSPSLVSRGSLGSDTAVAYPSPPPSQNHHEYLHGMPAPSPAPRTFQRRPSTSQYSVSSSITRHIPPLAPPPSHAPPPLPSAPPFSTAFPKSSISSPHSPQHVTVKVQHVPSGTAVMLRLPRETPIGELCDRARQKFKESESVDFEWSDSSDLSSATDPSSPSSTLSLYYRTVPPPGSTMLPPPQYSQNNSSPRVRSASVSSVGTSHDQPQKYTRIQSGEDWARALAAAAPGEKLVLRLDAKAEAVEVL